MTRTSALILAIHVCVLISSLKGQSCTYVKNVLECNVTSGVVTVDSSLCSGCTPSSVKIHYSQNTILNVNLSTAGTIFIVPTDPTSSDNLQIMTLQSNASQIQITVLLSSNQLPLPLFPIGGNILAPTTTLQITVMQMIFDASNFKVFNRITMNVAGYELDFNSNICSDTACGTLNLVNLVGQSSTTLLAISISGNGHLLSVNNALMSSMSNVLRLSLNQFRLYDKILSQFPQLNTLIIENCEYNRTAQFLQAPLSNTITTLTMKDNNPLDLILPYDSLALANLNQLTSITLIEPKLNSSCLNAFTAALASNLRTIVLELDSYRSNDFDKWLINSPNAMFFTINNIPNLNVFPSGFCNRLYALTRLTLQGSFGLVRQDVCVLAGMPRADYQKYPVIILNSSQQGTVNWDNCVQTYIDAINVQSYATIRCPPRDTNADCLRWAKQTQQCSLETLENTCNNTRNNKSLSFYYQTSILRQFFIDRLALNSNNSTGSPSDEPVNVGAIVGAVCGLLFAIAILVVTIFCVFQRRNNANTRSLSSLPEGKYRTKSSSNDGIYSDSSNISIATSKTGHSSLTPLEKTFFPPVHPDDIIAPPLYATAPSVSSRSFYGSPSGPSAPRDSLRTQTTHIYETLDT